MSKMLFSMIALLLPFTMVQAEENLQTVPYVDLSAYAGTWYQVAGIPQPFDKDCVCNRQVLTAQDDGTVGVRNTCNLKAPGGPLLSISGTATVVDTTTNAQLKVDFGMPEPGDYWIIALDREYRYAVVSEPSKKALFILSRTPVLETALYERAIDQAAAQVDTSALKITEQKNCSYTR
jgi:apolipoprotein D and lipocalin family protein